MVQLKKRPRPSSDGDTWCYVLPKNKWTLLTTALAQGLILMLFTGDDASLEQELSYLSGLNALELDLSEHGSRRHRHPISDPEAFTCDTLLHHLRTNVDETHSNPGYLPEIKENRAFLRYMTEPYNFWISNPQFDREIFKDGIYHDAATKLELWKELTHSSTTNTRRYVFTNQLDWGWYPLYELSRGSMVDIHYAQEAPASVSNQIRFCEAAVMNKFTDVYYGNPSEAKLSLAKDLRNQAKRIVNCDNNRDEEQIAAWTVSGMTFPEMLRPLQDDNVGMSTLISNRRVDTLWIEYHPAKELKMEEYGKDLTVFLDFVEGTLTDSGYDLAFYRKQTISAKHGHCPSGFQKAGEGASMTCPPFQPYFLSSSDMNVPATIRDSCFDREGFISCELVFRRRRRKDQGGPRAVSPLCKK